MGEGGAQFVGALRRETRGRTGQMVVHEIEHGPVVGAALLRISGKTHHVVRPEERVEFVGSLARLQPERVEWRPRLSDAGSVIVLALQK